MEWEQLPESVEERPHGAWTRAEVEQMVYEQQLENNRDAHFHPRKHTKNSIPLHEARKMARKYREGQSVKDLAKFFHRGQDTVIATLKEMNVIMRPSGKTRGRR